MRKIFIMVALMTASMFVSCGQSKSDATMIDTITLDTIDCDSFPSDTLIDDGCDL